VSAVKVKVITIIYMNVLFKITYVNPFRQTLFKTLVVSACTLYFLVTTPNLVITNVSLKLFSHS